MPRRSWQLRIEDTLQAIERIGDYTKTLDFEAFSADQRTIDAVLRNLEIIGEASRHVPEDICEQYSSLPWHEMRAMRNILTHGYFLVDLGIVWKTIRDDLPLIEPTLKRILEEDQ